MTTLAGTRENALALIDIYAIHAFSVPEDPLFDANGDPIPNVWGAGVPVGYDLSTWPHYYVWQGNSDVIDINIFKSRITAFRQWMKNVGPLEQAKPLWITEYGSLFKPSAGVSDYEASLYMEQTWDFLLGTKDPNIGDPNDDNRLAQKWIWYSVNDSIWFGGSLYDSITRQLTEVGDHFIKYNPSTSMVPVTDPDVYVDPSSQATVAPGSFGHYKITLKVGNTVSTDRLTGVQVELLLGGQVVGTVVADLPRCAGTLLVSFDVPNLVAGQSYEFTARISPAVGNGTDVDLTNNENIFSSITMPTLYNVMVPVIKK